MPLGKSSPSIRTATRKDIPGIAECARTATSEEEDIGFGVPPTERTFPYEEKLSAAWTEPNKVGNEEVWIAEVDGRVVGYVTTEDRSGTLELINIDVRKDLQGMGVGTALVKFVEAMASKAGKSAVTLGTSQKADGTPWKSLPWWRHLGYTVTGVEENAWTRRVGPGVKEIRMWKHLARSGPE
jgi:N-acetylglutamate synthase-like GNAT family acetyltransferase